MSSEDPSHSLPAPHSDCEETSPSAQNAPDESLPQKTAKKTSRKVAKKAAKKTTAKKAVARKTAKKAAKTTPEKKAISSAENATSELQKEPPTTSAEQLTLLAEPEKTAPSGAKKSLTPAIDSAVEAAVPSGEDPSQSAQSDKPAETSERTERQERKKHAGNRDSKRHPREPKKKREIVLTGDPLEVEGLIELAPKGYGFLRSPEKGYEQARDDVFVPPEYVKNHDIRHCMWVKGMARMGPKGLQLTEVTSINAVPVAEHQQAPFFEDLKAINPEKRISFETDSSCFTTRVLDLVSPVGRGQRGLIVAPPRSGKTTFLMDIAKALQERHEDTIHPIFLLIDERPEEVTEFKRELPDIEMFASSNDSGNRNHCRIAELCIERAKRLVEQGKHVFILMDSITRLARAYNRSSDGGKGSKGRGYQSGGLVSGALEVPRRLFAAARNTRDGGSLTILATALVQTNSKADEAIFQEFKGTGNMEIVLDRRLADHYIYPAVDIFKSGTRREELILPEMTLRKFHLIRRGLKGHRPNEAMERLLFFLKKFNSNAQMLLEIKG